MTATHNALAWGSTVVLAGRSITVDPALWGGGVLLCTDDGSWRISEGPLQSWAQVDMPLLPPPSSLSTEREARPGEAAAAFDVHCTGDANDGPGRIWQLEAGYLSWHKDGPVYWPWNESYVDPPRIAPMQRDLQKYAVITAWLAAVQQPVEVPHV